MNRAIWIKSQYILLAAAGLIIALLSGCASVDISLLPMYGDVEKTEKQKNADATYLEYMDAHFDDRRASSETAARAGWNYWYKGDWQTAMRRFNQAWLLDSDNYSAYWGYVVILGMQGNYLDSSNMGDIALSLAPGNQKLICDVAFSNANYASTIKLNRTDKERYLQKALSMYEQAATVAPEEPCMNWAVTLYNHGQYLAAWEQVKKAEQLGYNYPEVFLNELSRILPRPESL